MLTFSNYDTDVDWLMSLVSSLVSRFGVGESFSKK